MLAAPAPQLLMLDEPTSNLDLASVRQLTSALDSYQGALLIASHDLPFLESAGITRWLLLAVRCWYRTRMGFPVCTENSVIVKPNILGRADRWKNGATSLVPSPVMSGTSVIRCPALLCSQPASLLGMGIRVLEASRLPTGAAVSSRRSCAGMFPFLARVLTLNSSVRLSASHDSAPLLTSRDSSPVVPLPGHTHCRPAPVASEKTWIVEPVCLWPGHSDTASLLPSGDSARPEMISVSGGMGRAARRPG
jgi:hypothetical protein